MSKFRNKYRIESNRMPYWDYSCNGIYFITIVVQNRECILGKIENNKMLLSDFGKIVQTEWYKSFEIRKELFLDEFIIMPNHLHALIKLEKPVKHVETHGCASLQSTTNEQSTENERSITNQSKLNNKSINKPSFYRKPKSISSFIGGFKSAVTTNIDDFIDENNLPITKYNRRNRFWQLNYNDILCVIKTNIGV